jgi:hypothetical protein
MGYKVRSSALITLFITIRLDFTTDTGFYITSKSSTLKMEQIECSETSVSINQTPGKHPKVSTLELLGCLMILNVEYYQIIGHTQFRILLYRMSWLEV